MRARVSAGLVLAATLAGCSADSGQTSPTAQTTSPGSRSAVATTGPTTAPAASPDPEQGAAPEAGDPAAAPPSADGGCDGSFGAGAVPSVVVGPGQTCVLNSTQVDGDVTVQEGGALTLAGVTVQGGITAVGAREITLNGANVAGRTSIADSGTVSLLQSVLGEVALTGNPGSVEVSGNTLSGDLRCEGNAQKPTGGQNQGGARTGQCSGL